MGPNFKEKLEKKVLAFFTCMKYFVLLKVFKQFSIMNKHREDFCKDNYEENYFIDATLKENFCKYIYLFRGCHFSLHLDFIFSNSAYKCLRLQIPN